MRACVQRVTEARVTIGEEAVGRIGRGLLVLVGVAADDTAADVRWLSEKLVGLRVFDDGQGKMNLGLLEVGGALLVVSQFTLLGDCRKGRRPSYAHAAEPALAEELYQLFIEDLRSRGAAVEAGRFRQHMLVSLVNDGPVTLLIDSKRGSDE
jgi:D-tyrosyl-tRNA(Tyr) deacylase